MSNFKDFMAEIGKVEDRKAEAQAEVNGLTSLKLQKESEYSTAEILGEDTQTLKNELEQIEADLKTAIRRVGVFNGKVSVVEKLKGKKTITDKAENILDDNLSAICNLQNSYYIKAKELAVLKASFLSVVAEMGTISRQADQHAGESNQLVKYVPKKENTFISGIETGCQLHKATGIIFISPTDSLEAFRSVR